MLRGSGKQLVDIAGNLLMSLCQFAEPCILPIKLADGCCCRYCQLIKLSATDLFFDQCPEIFLFIAPITIERLLRLPDFGVMATILFLDKCRIRTSRKINRLQHEIMIEIFPLGVHFFLLFLDMIGHLLGQSLDTVERCLMVTEDQATRMGQFMHGAMLIIKLPVPADSVKFLKDFHTLPGRDNQHDFITAPKQDFQPNRVLNALALLMINCAKILISVRIIRNFLQELPAFALDVVIKTLQIFRSLAAFLNITETVTIKIEDCDLIVAVGEIRVM